jgi:hypothetical protein
LENGKYKVGYFDKYNANNNIVVKTYTLSDEIDACANFIKLELEDLRKNSSKNIRKNKKFCKFNNRKVIIIILCLIVFIIVFIGLTIFKNML